MLQHDRALKSHRRPAGLGSSLKGCHVGAEQSPGSARAHHSRKERTHRESRASANTARRRLCRSRPHRTPVAGIRARAIRCGSVKSGRYGWDMSWVDGFVFSEPMIDLRHDQSRASLLADELHREVGVGHPLAGERWTVVAEAEPQDDVVVVAGAQVAMVHLTWSGRRESPPWPSHDAIPGPEALQRLIADRY